MGSRDRREKIKSSYEQHEDLTLTTAAAAATAQVGESESAAAARQRALRIPAALQHLYQFFTPSNATVSSVQRRR